MSPRLTDALTKSARDNKEESECESGTTGSAAGLQVVVVVFSSLSRNGNISTNNTQGEGGRRF